MALENLPLEKIRANTDQPRKSFYSESLEELAASIKERGVLEPIVVRPMPGQKGMYEIVMGERRFRASKLAGKETIPAIIREDYSDEDAAADALLENFQREDLNPVEKAKAVEQLLQMMSYEKVCKTLGVSETTVRRLLELLELPPQIQQELVYRPGAQSAFTEGHARVLATVSDDPEIQLRLAQKVKSEKMTVGALEQLVGAVKKFPNKREVFLRVSGAVADQMVRSLSAQDERKKPYKAQTAKEHLKAIDRQAWGLTDLLDDRIVDYLTPEEMSHLLAITMQVTKQMELFNHRVRTALENRTFGFKEVYIHCPLCGRIELVSALRCSTCWTVLRRCVDCGNHNAAKQICGVTGKPIDSEDAENPQVSSPSYKCPDYTPKFSPKLMSNKMRMAGS
jgi:ParB family chromosome partitioning protein